MKTRSLMIGALGLFTLAVPATAAAQGAYGYGYNPPVRNTACEQQRRDDKMAGTLIGVVGGALIGGAIGNNVEDGDAHWHRGRRGRGYGRRGGYYHGNGNSDEVAAGALIGALIGGVAGNSMAGSTSRPCAVAAPGYYDSGRGYPEGSIPRTTDGLYGGPEIASSHPSYPSYPETPPPSRRYPASSAPEPAYPAYPDYSGAEARECRTIERETRMPDGQVFRDPVTACRDPYDGTWVLEDGSGDYDY